MATLYKMKEDLSVLRQEIGKVNDEMVSKAADPSIKVDEIDELEKRLNDLGRRYDTLKKVHDKQEDDEKEKVKQTAAANATVNSDPKIAKAMAKGEFYRTAIDGGNTRVVAQKAFQHLGAIPAGDADLGYGDKLIPTTMLNEIIVEPVEMNPLRSVARVSNIRGLEEPKLLFDLEGAYDSITDKETAKEIEVQGDLVSYGRFKVKPMAKVADTVVHGSPLALSGEIDNALSTGLAVNEMSRMFATTPESGYEHMSFYSTDNAVKSVSGTTTQKAIALALADLPTMFRANASIVMNPTQWYEMWGDNLNQSGMFYEDRPLTLFGKRVILMDYAVRPVVGDFNYCRINYDIGTIYDADKDVISGLYRFVLTAWYDIKLRLASAFRIATVNP